MRAPIVLAVLLAGLGAPAAPAFTHATPIPAGGAPWLASGPCAGALVAPDEVLTAAHCVAAADRVPEIAVGGRPVAVRSIAVHPRFAFWHDPRGRGTSARWDLAVLRLAEPVPDVTPLALVVARPGAGARGVAYAKGVAAPFAIRADRVCAHAYGAAFAPSSTLCASDLHAPFSVPCAGDSGGPLVIGGRLAGLVSWSTEVRGRGCVASGRASGFSDLSAMRAFVTAPPAPPKPLPVAPGTGTTVAVDRAAGIARCVLPPLVSEATATMVRWSGRPPGARGADRHVPGAGAADLHLGRRNAGWRVRCTATASSPGGSTTFAGARRVPLAP